MQDDDRTYGLTLEEMATIDAGITLGELAEMGLTLDELLARDAERDAALGLSENFSVNQRLAMRPLDMIYEGFKSARDGSMIYPDFYGGSAIDSDGMPVIFIVESRLEEAYSHNVIGALLETGLRYRFVMYSYTELRITQFEISGIIGERFWAYQCIYSNNVSFIGADVLNNGVVVFLSEYNEQMINGFRRYVYDSSMLILRQGRIDLGGGQGNATFCYNDIDWHYNNNNRDYIHYHENIAPFNTCLSLGRSVVRSIYSIRPPFFADICHSRI